MSQYCSFTAALNNPEVLTRLAAGNCPQGMLCEDSDCPQWHTSQSQVDDGS